MRELPLLLHETLLEVVAGERLQARIRHGLFRYEASFTLAPLGGEPPRTRVGLQIQVANELPLVGGTLDRFAVRRLATELAATQLMALRDWCEAARPERRSRGALRPPPRSAPVRRCRSCGNLMPLVLGAGSVGLALAAQLAAAGREVTLLVRRSEAAASLRAGLVAEDPIAGGERRLPVAATDDLAAALTRSGDGAVFVCTREPDSEAVGRALARHAPERLAVAVQNDLTGGERLARSLPRVVAAVWRQTATRVGRRPRALPRRRPRGARRRAGLRRPPPTRPRWRASSPRRGSTPPARSASARTSG